MTREIKTPAPEYLRKTVEEMVKKFGISECVYEKCVNEFSELKLRELKKSDSVRIVRPFLFTWGQMARWLGDAGIERVSQKLRERAFAARIEPLRQFDLRSTESGNLRKSVVELFDELMHTKFKSKSRKRQLLKDINPTTTSKILHLCCPDLFIMWDTNIRIGYGKKKGNGEDYFQFLVKMKDFWEKLNDTIEELHQRLGIRHTRIIDIYNWAEGRKQEEREKRRKLNKKRQNAYRSPSSCSS